LNFTATDVTKSLENYNKSAKKVDLLRRIRNMVRGWVPLSPK